MFRHCVIDGKRIAYTDNTVFLVQVGRNRKAAYKTRYSVKGNPIQAIVFYQGST